MPRLVWNVAPPGALKTPPAEIHYGSPSEFVIEFAPGIDSGRVFFRTDRPPAVGDTRDLLIEIGFIARTFRIRAEVEESTTLGESRRAGKPPGAWVKLLDIDDDLRAEMKKLVLQIQQGLTFDAAKVTIGASGERLSAEKRIRAMPATLKIMLALKADREERLALANDPDPQVVQFLLKNAKLGLDEIRAISARPTLSHQHVVTIAGNPTWFNDERVRLNLARNPRLPELLVNQVLESLSVAQLRIVIAAVSTSGRARQLAHKILYNKGL